MSKNLLLDTEFQRAKDTIKLLNCYCLKVINGENIEKNDHDELIRLLAQNNNFSNSIEDLLNKVSCYEPKYNEDLVFYIIFIAQLIYNDMVDKTIICINT